MEINCIAPKRALQLSTCSASSTLGGTVLAKSFKIDVICQFAKIICSVKWIQWARSMVYNRTLFITLLADLLIMILLPPSALSHLPVQLGMGMGMAYYYDINSQDKLNREERYGI